MIVPELQHNKHLYFSSGLNWQFGGDLLCSLATNGGSVSSVSTTFDSKIPAVQFCRKTYGTNYFLDIKKTSESQCLRILLAMLVAQPYSLDIRPLWSSISSYRNMLSLSNNLFYRHGPQSTKPLVISSNMRQTFWFLREMSRLLLDGLPMKFSSDIYGLHRMNLNDPSTFLSFFNLAPPTGQHLQDALTQMFVQTVMVPRGSSPGLVAQRTQAQSDRGCSMAAPCRLLVLAGAIAFWKNLNITDIKKNHTDNKTRLYDNDIVCVFI